jgi:hypothetical protein
VLLSADSTRRRGPDSDVTRNEAHEGPQGRRIDLNLLIEPLLFEGWMGAGAGAGLYGRFQ